MNVKGEQDVIQLIEADEWMMEVLQAAQKLHLPDWWVCAGFVRSKIWDTLHGFEERTPLPDIDVIYFDASNVEERVEKQLEDKLREIAPGFPWSVKNQARMHKINDLPPYTSSVEGISKFPETVTALGVKLNDYHNVILTAPCGINDVINLEVKPTPFFSTLDRIRVYQQRVKKKNWKSIWTKLKLHNLD